MIKQKSMLHIIIYAFTIAALAGIIYFAAESSDLNQAACLDCLHGDFYHDHHLTSIWDKLVFRAKVQPFNLAALIVFLLAIIHTFFCHRFNLLSQWIIKKNTKKYGVHTETFASEICHFLGEIEVVFGLWVIPLLIVMMHYFDWTTALNYLNERDYTEPMFVVVIMALAATRPVLSFVETILKTVAKLGKESVKAWWWVILTIAPLMGSFITEPGAMTIAALLLGQQFYRYKPSQRFAYATLGLLFTNVSVGGVLTNFAAPPVLMVNKVWGWSTPYMMEHFGTKAILGICIANLLYFLIFRNEFVRMEKEHKKHKKQLSEQQKTEIPFWITLTHIAFMAWIVVYAHYPIIFIGAFLLFLGFHQATKKYQDELQLKIPMLVGYFLAGLVVHGGVQAWWISPLLSSVKEGSLFLLSSVLTAFNDNAAITFLATLTPDFSDSLKHTVVAGAITGGGLTVIANAPNPAGAAILGEHFEQGISFVGLLLGALIPTLIVGTCFYIAHCC